MCIFAPRPRPGEGRLKTSVPIIRPSEWSEFYQRVAEETGLQLELYKPEHIQKRVLGMMESARLSSLPAFTEQSFQSGFTTQQFIDRLSVNVSELFRNPELWTSLQRDILPTIVRRQPNLRVWSAGCSYGAEAYSLACLLEAHFPGPHTILGTDVDSEAMAQARLGEFNEHDMRHVPSESMHYFRQNGSRWVAMPSLSRLMSFERHDLLSDPSPGAFDLILCRNVVIYLTEAAQRQVFRKLYEALEPGGVLFIGSTERVTNARELGFEIIAPFFYRRPLSVATPAPLRTHWPRFAA